MPLPWNGLNAKVKKMINKLLKRFNEFLGIPIALIIFYFSPYVLRRFDPTAAALDAGYLHVIALGLVKVFIASPLAWLMLWMSFPRFYRYLDDDAENDVILGKVESRIGKAWIPVILYIVYFLALMYAFTPD